MPSITTILAIVGAVLGVINAIIQVTANRRSVKLEVVKERARYKFVIRNLGSRSIRIQEMKLEAYSKKHKTWIKVCEEPEEIEYTNEQPSESSNSVLFPLDDSFNASLFNKVRFTVKLQTGKEYSIEHDNEWPKSKRKKHV